MKKVRGKIYVYCEEICMRVGWADACRCIRMSLHAFFYITGIWDGLLLTRRPFAFSNGQPNKHDEIQQALPMIRVKVKTASGLCVACVLRVCEALLLPHLVCLATCLDPVLLITATWREWFVVAGVADIVFTRLDAAARACGVPCFL